MALQNNIKKLFIHNSLLILECGVEKLREFLLTPEIMNHTVISGINEDALVIQLPSLARQRYTLTDTAFQYYVEQKVTDGYVYASIESFKKLVGLD